MARPTTRRHPHKSVSVGAGYGMSHIEIYQLDVEPNPPTGVQVEP